LKRVATEAEMRRIELDNELLNATLTQARLAAADAGTGAVPEAKPIDPGVLKEIEQYVLEKLRENEPMPPLLERVLTEANTPEPPPPAPVVDRSTGVASHALPPPPPPKPEPMARGAAYSALYTAKETAAACGQEGGPRGQG